MQSGDISALFYYAAVSLRRIKRLARPSICLSASFAVPYELLTQKRKKNMKDQRWCDSFPATVVLVFSLEDQRSRSLDIKVSRKLIHMSRKYLLIMRTHEPAHAQGAARCAAIDWCAVGTYYTRITAFIWAGHIAWRRLCWLSVLYLKVATANNF